ncbi:hypothetical protein [Pseudonocardia xishanensis]|uniref:Uncharacterized protein n=1 Tax=Pseudonocardia xishanensis TaxID=630995 RepID=A0ABP8RS55_9PSEU
MTEEPDGLLGARGRRVLVLGSVVVMLMLLVWAGVQALRAPAAAPPVAAGQVRLGPEPGEAVEGYLARVPATLPAPGERAFALVQLAPEVTTAQAATLVGTAPVAQVVLRLPLPRVQTALRFESIPAGAPLAAALDTARQRAGYAAAAEAARSAAAEPTLDGGRPAAVARAEAAGYSQPCACVLALLVQADRAGLDRLAGTPVVRAVEAAPVGVTAPELALSPLLPDQTTAATPLPDDGPV